MTEVVAPLNAEKTELRRTLEHTDGSHSQDPENFDKLPDAVRSKLGQIVNDAVVRIFTDAINYVGDYTDQSIEIVRYVLTPLRLALQGKSQSEVLSAISDARK